MFADRHRGRSDGAEFVPAEVIARWETARVLLRLPSGDAVEADVPSHLQSACDIGDRVWVSLDDAGRVVSWRGS